jgi:hypothetical protein
VAKIAQLGDPAIPVLVETLGSPRPRVADASKRALMEEIDRWKMLRAAEYSPKLALLAEALADHVGRFAPPARQEAAGLAARILRLWKLDPDVIDPDAVITHCEQVVRIAAASRPSPPADQRPLRLAQASAPGKPWESPEPDPNPLRPSPGLRVPATIALPDGMVRSSEDDQPVDLLEARGTEFQTVNGGGVAFGEHDVRPHLRQPRPLGMPPADAIAIPEPLGRDAWPPQPVPQPSDVSERYEKRGPTAHPSDVEPGRLPSVELMRLLHCPNRRTVAEAEAELARRGFQELHLRLARRMFDPDSKIRLELVQSLPEASVDAAPWLLQLSRDEDAEVRLSAMALVATTGDPALADAIEAIAREDPDPHVRSQAERFASQRRGRRY